MEPVVVTNADSLWLIAGAFALFLGVVAFGINYNIRRTRDSASKSQDALRREVERLRAQQGRTTSQESDLRGEALEELLRREPELASRTDSESVRRIRELTDEISRDMRTRREIEAVKARQEQERQREQSAREVAEKIEEGRRRAELRRQEEEQRLQSERQQRLEQLEAMPPAKRFFAEHWLKTSVASVLVIGLATGSGIAGWGALQRAQQQAASEEAAALAQRERDAQSQAEAEEIARLSAACDPNLPDIPLDVWQAWLECEDPRVVEKAYLQAQPDRPSTEIMRKIAGVTEDADLALRLSTDLPADSDIHEILVSRFSAEDVAPSYKKLYGLGCTPGVDPDEYLGNSTWLAGDSRVKFAIDGCRVEGYLPGDGSWIWTQYVDKVRIRNYNYVRQQGNLVLDPDLPFEVGPEYPRKLVPVR